MKKLTTATRAREVIRDSPGQGSRQPQSLNLDQDSPELAALVREGMRSRHTRHRKGDTRKLLERVRQRLR